MNLENKNVVITGGTSGIGLATAKAFIDKGANVWITGRKQKTLDLASQEINHPKLKTIVSDISKIKDIDFITEVLEKENIKIDVLHLNAGIATFSPLESATEEDFDAQFNTNVKGAYFTLQKMLPFFVEGSSVIFTSSTNATAAQLGSTIYSATKGALNKIAQIASNELASKKIRVNIVSPGPTETPGLNNALPEGAKEYLQSVIALQRIGNPSEIAKAVLFLASEESSFITGTEIIVDGGLINYSLK